MIDLESETLLPLKAAAGHKLLRAKSPNRKAVNFSTIWRWATRGSRGVQLETARVGSTLVTSVEALHRFIDRLSNPETPPGKPTASETTRAHRRAESELAAAGI